jgi:hypothetical protein
MFRNAETPTSVNSVASRASAEALSAYLLGAERCHMLGAERCLIADAPIADVRADALDVAMCLCTVCRIAVHIVVDRIGVVAEHYH